MSDVDKNYYQVMNHLFDEIGRNFIEYPDKTSELMGQLVSMHRVRMRRSQMHVVKTEYKDNEEKRK